MLQPRLLGMVLIWPIGDVESSALVIWEGDDACNLLVWNRDGGSAVHYNVPRDKVLSAAVATSGAGELRALVPPAPLPTPVEPPPPITPED